MKVAARIYSLWAKWFNRPQITCLELVLIGALIGPEATNFVTSVCQLKSTASPVRSPKLLLCSTYEIQKSMRLKEPTVNIVPFNRRNDEVVYQELQETFDKSHVKDVFCPSHYDQQRCRRVIWHSTQQHLPFGASFILPVRLGPHFQVSILSKISKLVSNNITSFFKLGTIDTTASFGMALKFHPTAVLLMLDEKS